MAPHLELNERQKTHFRASHAAPPGAHSLETRSRTRPKWRPRFQPSKLQIKDSGSLCSFRELHHYTVKVFQIWYWRGMEITFFQKVEPAFFSETIRSPTESVWTKTNLFEFARLHVCTAFVHLHPKQRGAIRAEHWCVHTHTVTAQLDYNTNTPNVFNIRRMQTPEMFSRLRE